MGVGVFLWARYPCISLSRSLSLSIGVRPMVDPAQMAGSGVCVFLLAIAQRRERAPPLSFSRSLSFSLFPSLSLSHSLSRSLALGVRPMVQSILARAYPYPPLFPSLPPSISLSRSLHLSRSLLLYISLSLSLALSLLG